MRSVRASEVFRFEVEYALRRFTTWIYAAGLFGLAVLVTLVYATGGEPGNANAPATVAVFAVVAGLVGMLVTAGLFGEAAIRDFQLEMDPLLFTCPLTKVEYLGGRFLAALALNATLLIAIPLGEVIAALVLPYLEPEKFGPFQGAAFLQPFLFLLLPNLVITGATLFTIAMLTRQTIPVYLGAIGFLISAPLFLSAFDEGANPMLSALADPTGLATVVEMWRYRTPVERDTLLIGFPAALMWNRVVWLTVAALALVLLHRRFRFGHPAADGRRAARAPRAPGLPSSPRSPRSPSAPSAPGAPSVWQTFSIARNSFEQIALSRTFLVVLLGGFGLTLLFAWEVGSTAFDTSTWPVTILVVEQLLNTPLVPITFVLTAIFAGELVWKARELDVAEIVDAMPVSDGAAVAGRFLALVAILAILQIPIMAGGILLQALRGYDHFEVGLYLRLLLALNLPDLVIIAALAMTIHVVVNQKYLGHIVVVMACVFPVVARENGIVRHHLLLYGMDPGWRYSDMNGFGPFIGPFVWFKLYWAAWALLLGVVATVFLVRGRELGLRRRLLEARARFAGPSGRHIARTAGVAVALIVVVGGFIFYNTNILNAHRTPDEEGSTQAEYEKRYARFAELPQPTIVSADLRIEIYPDEHAVDLRGSFRLVNQTAAAIDSVHVTFFDPNLQVRSLSFDRVAKAVVVDDEVPYRIYALERALEPGDSLQLAFDVAFRPRGFPNSSIQTDVVANGAYFNRGWMPFIGYQRIFELSGDEARKRFGLGPQPPMRNPSDPGPRQYRQGYRDADLVQVNAVVGTAADQIAITPGVLRRSWTENGRRYFHYETEEPTPFGSTVFSAKYAVLEDRWNDVDLRIFHHPTHRYVLDRMVRGMKASLEYFTNQFGPYRDGQLRIAEIPRYGVFGRAHPHTVAFTEDNFLYRVREGQIDQPFYGTAHEVAHQWWGAQVRGATGVRGHGFLSESLANYSAMMVTEKVYGPEAARRVYHFQMQRYLTGRALQSREVPLLEVEDQPYIAYRKGAIAMYTLRDHIGEERVNLALRRFVEKQRDGKPPYPTSLDLYAELRAVTPGSHHQLLKDLFEEITLWEVRTTRAIVEPTGTGEYQVTLDVVAKKMRADSVGNETEVPMDDLIEIGVFAADQRLPRVSEASRGEALYLQRHRIRGGEQTIRITVPREPMRAGIDPYRKLIDRKSDDNVIAVVRAASSGRTR